jgi:hypothetical protein
MLNLPQFVPSLSPLESTRLTFPSADVYYCSRQHQLSDWKAHKSFCKSTVATQSKPSAPSSPSGPISPLPLPGTASFPLFPQDSTTLHWTFHPSSASASTGASLALHCTSRTLAALRTTSFFSLSSASSPPLSSYTPLFTLSDIVGKGKGLIASADLAPDSLVLLDRPLLVWAPDALPRPHLNALLSHALSRLSEEKQNEFLSLSNAFPSLSVGDFLGRVETNSLPVVSLSDLPPTTTPQPDAVTYSGLFPLAARVNHACDANCRLEWSSERWVLGVRTNRAVKKGEELCISYILPFQKRRERREELRTKVR